MFYIPEDGILHSYRHENLKSYKINILCMTIMFNLLQSVCLFRSRRADRANNTFLVAVSMGGATGLFLGASLTSAVELIMYFCIRPLPRIRQR
jgi:hypothetical protein